MSRKIDHQITPEDERTLDEHLIVCPACRNQYQAWVAQSQTAKAGLKALWPERRSDFQQLP
jgi:predicted anti-sigma-YlaC factor YlaD